MDRFITIDGGTTNTRISLVFDYEIKDVINIHAGVMTTERTEFISKIQEAISKLLSDYNLRVSQIERIIASGMITSEKGLYELPHIQCPVGVEGLHDSMKEIYLLDISDIPFAFIPGVKKLTDSFESSDIMRGEESEIMGIPCDIKCVCVLCGSHTKHVLLDRKGAISDFSTTLTGEMIASLSQNTILRDAVNLDISELDTDYLLKGYDYCISNGINKALFKARVLKNAFSASPEQVYSFFMGVVLTGDVTEIIKYKISDVFLTGRDEIKNALAQILKNRTKLSVNILSKEDVEKSNTIGMIRIYNWSE